ncbi:lipoprotein [Actinorhabdospora filicis]|uniref:Lipoprotein n=1 Tax=Actinorhabdospora filicis TaxID=1785913 RepID=A0A9W6W6B4_9ACTN|nr:lipoprotein [Actinorhabdospora filicis]
MVNHGPREGTMVALTFDADLTEFMKKQLESGEVATYHNEPLLAYLEKEKVAATFFMTGMWAGQYGDVAKRIAGNPLFELANHTYSHQAFTDKCYGLAFEDDPAAMLADVDRTFGVLEALGGNQTRYFRYPGLCHDERALEALAPLGVTVVDGDVVSGDPFAEASQPIVDAVLGKAKAGSVVIMHIGGPNAPQTHKALPKIVEGLRAKGMTFGRLSEVLGA